MGTDINKNTTDIDAKEIHEVMDFSLALGFGTDKINFNARYNFGVSQNFDFGSSEEVDVQNEII